MIATQIEPVRTIALLALATGERSRDGLSDGWSETSAVDVVYGVAALTIAADRFDTLAVERQRDANNPHNVQGWYVEGVGEVDERDGGCTEARRSGQRVDVDCGGGDD